MKQIAVRATSMHSPRPFTATGLGDRIHCCTVAWCYGKGVPVTLHLNAAHLEGGQFANKVESWIEIVDLFPPEALRLRYHLTRYTTERAWATETGAPTWRYSDHPTRRDAPDAVDATPLLRDLPRLRAAPQDIELPPRFFTVQWDANGAQRTVTAEQRQVLELRYRAQGLEPVVLGGQATDHHLRWSLPHAAYALSRAEFHLGADSAFMHLALLYLPPERVRIYTRELTHHTRRARDNGAEVTLCS